MSAKARESGRETHRETHTCTGRQERRDSEGLNDLPKVTVLV